MIVWVARFIDYEDGPIICVSPRLLDVIAECKRHFGRMHEYRGMCATSCDIKIYLRLVTRFSPLRYEAYEISGYTIS